MGYTFPQIVLMIVGLLVYFVKPSWLMLLWLISTPLLGPFIVLFSGVTDFADQQMLVWNLWGVFNRVFLLIIVIELFKGHKFPKRVTKLVIPVLCLFAYFVIHNFLTHFYLSTIIRNIVYIIYALVPLCVFLLNDKVWPSIKEVYIVVVIVCLVQLVFIPLNLQGFSAYSGKYQELINGGNQTILLSGTFTRSNMMGDYLSIVYLFITIDYFSRKSISVIQYIFVSVIFIIPMLYAGSKVTIAATIINILFSIISFNFTKKGLPIISIAIILASLFYCFLLTNNIKNVSSNEGLSRFIVEMSDLVQLKKKGSTDDSTLQYSTDLLNKYFASAPLIGHGNYYKEDENAYNSVLDVSGLKSDATLAFYLVEYGIIGLLLFLWFQYSVIKFATSYLNIRHRNRIARLIFIFFLLFALTERGLFDRSYFIFIFVYIFSLARYYNERHQIVIS